MKKDSEITKLIIQHSVNQMMMMGGILNLILMSGMSPEDKDNFKELVLKEMKDSKDLIEEFKNTLT